MRLAILLLACASHVALPPPQKVSAPPQLPRMVIQLDRPLSTHHLKAGDVFSARVIHAGVLGESRVLGVVTESHRGNEPEDPILRLRIRTLIRGGCKVPIQAHITSAEVKEVSHPPGDAWRDGAINGALLGGLMLWNPGMVTGFGLGFAGGAIKEAGNLKDDVFLPAGALLTLQIERPIPPCQRPSRETPSSRPM